MYLHDFKRACPVFRPCIISTLITRRAAFTRVISIQPKIILLFPAILLETKKIGILIEADVSGTALLASGDSNAKGTFNLIGPGGSVIESASISSSSVLNQGRITTQNFVQSIILAPGNYRFEFIAETDAEVYGVFNIGTNLRADHYSQSAFIVTANAETLTGDFNGDGIVSQGDLDLVLLNWGSTTQPVGWVADEQFDGLISQQEQDIVLLNWGNTI